nr:hypothetical protein [Tanacetum cinerariifolium]
MCTRSSSNLPVESPLNPSTSNPKRRNHRRSKQPFILEESPVDTMVDQRTMTFKATFHSRRISRRYDGRSTYYGEIATCTHRGLCRGNYGPPILAEQFELKHSLINMMTSDRFFELEKDNPHDHICWFNKITSTIKYKDVPNSAIKLMLFPFSLAEAARRTTNLRNEISNFQQRFDESFHEAWDRYKDLLHACHHHGFTKLHQLDTFYNVLTPADQDSLNSAAGGNLLERHTQCVLTIIENKSKCLAAGGNTFPELRDNIYGYVSAAAVNYTQGNSVYHPLGVDNQIRPPGFAQPNVQNNQNRFGQPQGYNRGSRSIPSNTIANPKGKLKAITTQSGIVLDGPFVHIPPPFINLNEDKCVEETLTDHDLAEYTIKVPPPLVQKSKPPSQRKFVVHQRDPLHPNIPYPLRMHKQKQQEKDKKMLKALISNKEKLLELENTPLNENFSVVILKKLPEKLGDPGKFLILCGFSELKCKYLADLGTSINLMPLSVWKKLGLPELISTQMTLELANRPICTPAGIARDVFFPIGKFTFPSDFVIVDYESDPKVPLILGRPFLRTARALIDVHGEKMILHDESINMINIFNDSSEDFRENLSVRHHQSGNPIFSTHKKLTSQEVKDDVFDPEEGNVIKSLDDNPTPDCMVKPLFPSIPVEDSNSFLKKYDSFLFEIEPDQGRLTSVVMKDNQAEPRVHVPKVLTTHPTLMLDSDFIPSDNSLPEFETFYFDIEEKNNGSSTIHVDISLPDLECFNFHFKPDPGELTSIVDSKICENFLSAKNVNLPPEEYHSPLFAYVVWIFLSFLTYSVVPPHLFSFGNKDTSFDPGIFNYHSPSLLPNVSHRC